MEIYRHQNDRKMKQNRVGELEYLTFPILEETGMVRHLFSTRLGGVSEGIYASMNLSYTRGDRKDAVDENYRRIAGVLGCALEDIVCSDQTHTTNLKAVGREDGGKGITRPRNYKDVDGLLTDEPGIILATFYADCVPLYFVDTKRRAIALAHSGWRGTVARMGQCVVEKMREVFGTDPADIVAAVGPSICQDCYEVSIDVIDQFKKVYPENTWDDIFYCKDSEEKKYQLDLWAANYHQLLLAGMKKENIHVSGLCTCCGSMVLFSHRASDGKRGNLNGFIMIQEGKVV